MTTINICSDSVTVTGHANYSEYGQDIVCAGISTLVYTLIYSIKNLTEDKIQYDIQPGMVNIKFWSLSDLTKVLVDSFFIGIELIANEYPNNVELCKH